MLRSALTAICDGIDFRAHYVEPNLHVLAALNVLCLDMKHFEFEL
jgi:hypothetical protein